MKSIHLRCCCGCSAEFADAAESYIDPHNGSPDRNGDIYLVEARAREWLDRHQACVATRNATLTAKRQPKRKQR